MRLSHKTYYKGSSLKLHLADEKYKERFKDFKKLYEKFEAIENGSELISRSDVKYNKKIIKQIDPDFILIF